MITYSLAVERLYALGHELHHGPVSKFELGQMRTLCAALGDPQRKTPSILVAGTNGKGSTAATLASILRAGGHRTGLYTSPHLLRINERIQLDGRPIPDEAFAVAYGRVNTLARLLVERGELPQLPSFFETVTAMAFCYFATEAAEVAVLEVGMGGRLDATNVVEPIMSIITDIDLDHQNYLGNTLAAIAGEKAGILRANVVAVTLPQHPEVNPVLGERMMELGSRAVNAARNLPPLSPGGDASADTSTDPTGYDATRYRLQVLGQEVEIASPLVGRHQLRNLALAITAAEELAAMGYSITPESIARGVRQTKWPGRFQRLAATTARPEIVIDVAHNPAGAWALRAALSQHYEGRPMVLLFAAMADKAVEQMAQILWPMMEHVVLTRVAGNPRAAQAAELARLAETLGVRHSVAATVPEAVQLAGQQARALGRNALLVVAGSIYLAGEALPALQEPDAKS